MKHTSPQSKNSTLTELAIASRPRSTETHLMPSALMNSSQLLSQQDVIHLQRTLGNRATLRRVNAHNGLIQRSVSDEQLAQTLQAYEARTGDYPSFLIRRIQGHFNVEVTGRFNASTVRAIGRWQDGRRPPTMRDRSTTGFLTPEEMLEIVATGLERDTERAAYIEGVSQVGEQWDSLSAQARLRALAAEVNERLTQIGVPTCRIWLDPELPPQTIARFEAGDWHIRVSAPLLNESDMAVDIISTLYHEARHAEQWWLAIRWLIQSNRFFEGITTPFAFPFNDWLQDIENLPDHIMTAARSGDVLHGEERRLGRMFAWTIYESDESHDPSFMTPLTEAFCQAREAHQEDPTPETEQAVEDARQEWQRGRAIYASWWHEQDTHFLQEVITTEYSQSHPSTPRQQPDPCATR